MFNPSQLFKYLTCCTTQAPSRGQKIAAYCATIVLLFGCASTNKTQQALLADDPLSPTQLQARAADIHSREQAQTLIAQAAQMQRAADEQYTQTQVQCYAKFFVNRCLDQAREARHLTWDSAQKDTNAARLYLRQQAAEEQRIALSQKLNTYAQQETRLAPQRARNAAEFHAQQKAQKERIAQYQKQQATAAPRRAQNVEAFNAKVKRIEAIKQKRIADAKKLQQSSAQAVTPPQ